jgi:hypothetical protein
MHNLVDNSFEVFLELSGVTAGTESHGVDSKFSQTPSGSVCVIGDTSPSCSYVGRMI